MISLSISNGTATPLTITDTGTTGYVLVALNPGGMLRDNAVATSRWLDGGALVSTRDEMATMEATIQTWGSSVSDVMTKVATLGSALGQWSYTVTASYSGGSAVYTAMPANYAVSYDPDFLRNNVALVTASIPRQP